MSYILDALKKSEQERARGETPDVTTRHDYGPPGSGTGSGRSRGVAWLVAGALCVNALLLAFWLFSDRPAEAPGPATAPPPVASRSSSEAPAPPRVAAHSGSEAPASAPVAPAAREVRPSSAGARGPQPAPAPTAARETSGSGPVETPVVAPVATRIAESGAPAERTDEEVPGDDAASQAAPAPSEPEPVSIRDLPDRIQRRIPTLEFATHIFGDAPRYREVTINGRRYAEGERVEGMLLSEITETGVVFDFEGYRFEMSVLDDWDY
ncbi:MAG: general secretion pathway protein GspB [Pseudomonadales bacterium]|jgi:general secretion pathway protein B|nr:general secretion pathway protein GspB [Pseudomonadales bacterium]